MKAYSTYHISDSKNSTRIIVTDEDPTGVTLTLKDMGDAEIKQASINMPRVEMIAALQYIINKIKAGIREGSVA